MGQRTYLSLDIVKFASYNTVMFFCNLYFENARFVDGAVRCGIRKRVWFPQGPQEIECDETVF